MEQDSSNQFLFIKSELGQEEKRTGRGRGGEYVPYKPTEEDEYWSSMSVEEQITSTIASYEKKSIKDEDLIYLVLGLAKQFSVKENGELSDRYKIFTPDFDNIVTRLSADVLAYLNRDHNKILIKCPVTNLMEFQEKERYNNKYFLPVKRIGPLLKSEQISPSLLYDHDWEKEEKNVILQTMPNIGVEKRSEYYHKMMSIIDKEDIDVTNIDNDVIYLKLDKKTAESLLEKSDLIFKIEKTPTAILDNYLTLDTYIEKKGQKPINENNYSLIPEICLLDSGINEIPCISGLISEKTGYYRFLNYDDGVETYGHGTPIACLASLSEDLDSPGARIISYKIYSDAQKNLALRGFRQGIINYSQRTRLFLSSIVFENYNPIATTLLDRMIQNANICFIMSAGNIQKEKLLEEIRNGINYPIYNFKYSVSDPAQAHSIFSVGSICKSDSDDTIAKRNQLSPFSRCGHRYSSMFSCSKPEVVQNGGNVCFDGSNYGCLNSYDKDGNIQNVFIGTSFAAPLVARQLAEIEHLYGNKILNAETFKAISIASTTRMVQDCIGYGETNYMTYCERDAAFLITEGTLILPYSTRPLHKLETYSEMKVEVSDAVKSIELILVHSDNGSRTSEPSLNTYLTVKARKQGRPSSYVKPLKPHENYKKTHIKHFKWEFKRKSMESEWTFIIKPDITAEMLDEHMREITIRYGCVIILNAKSNYRGASLTSDMINLMGDRLL